MVDYLPMAAAACGILAYGLEHLMVPRPNFWRGRAGACHALHWGLSLGAFSLLVLLLRRPGFALLIVLAFLLLVVMVNNAKYHSLREPFIAQDFEYFTDAIRHPRLYIPFLGWGRALIAGVAAVAAIWTGFALEPPLTEVIDWPRLALDLGLIGMLTAGLLYWGTHRCPVASYEPVRDLKTLGLLASLWRYALDERKVWQESRPLPALHKPARQDLLVVQSESFFDARRTYPELRADLLPELDRLRSEAMAHGQLAVPAWGANTVRTEFAFLSGLRQADMGVHRFNPYRALARAGVTTLASRLREAGYRTICVHPYPASFYTRDIVYPRLGFDELIDIAAFPDAERCGPYISDAAVAEKIEELLENRGGSSGQPLFIYVITMENHGPLHLEKVTPGDAERLYATVVPANCDDLTIYVRHLVNADHMFGRLRASLQSSPRASLLCLFGDHVPIMPGVYAGLREPDGSTDYLLWSNRCAVTAPATSMAVEDLAGRLLQELSLPGDVR